MFVVRDHLLHDPDPEGPAYSRLSAALSLDISAGRFEGSDRLKVRDLARLYGVSPSPVREALQVLHGKGLVEIDANKGARVRRLSPSQVEQACQINQALESLAARMLAETASDHQIDVLRDIDRRHRETYAAGDLDAMAAAGCEFHFQIYRFNRNDFVLQSAIVHSTLAHSSRRKVGFSDARLRALCPEHTAILDAIADRDPERAGRLAFEHARSCTDDLVDRLGSQERAQRR